MTTITIEVPGIPQGKGRARFTRKTGRAYTPAKTRSYEEQIAWAAKIAMGHQGPLSGPLRAVVGASMPIPRSWSLARRLDASNGLLYPTGKPDCDNLGKTALDALNGIVYADDAAIVEMTVSKLYSDRPCLWIDISQID